MDTHQEITRNSAVELLRVLQSGHQIRGEDFDALLRLKFVSVDRYVALVGQTEIRAITKQGLEALAEAN